MARTSGHHQWNQRNRRGPMNERHIELNRLLSIINGLCTPEKYQSTHNEFARATAKLMIEEACEEPVDKRSEILIKLGELLTHPLFDLINECFPISDNETYLIEIMTKAKNLEKKLGALWNLINVGNEEGSW
jgi:hypothetical protein